MSGIEVYSRTFIKSCTCTNENVKPDDLVELSLGAAVPAGWGQSGNCDRRYIGIERF